MTNLKITYSDSMARERLVWPKVQNSWTHCHLCRERTLDEGVSGRSLMHYKVRKSDSSQSCKCSRGCCAGVAQEAGSMKTGGTDQSETPHAWTLAQVEILVLPATCYMSLGNSPNPTETWFSHLENRIENSCLHHGVVVRMLLGQEPRTWKVFSDRCQHSQR